MKNNRYVIMGLIFISLLIFIPQKVSAKQKVITCPYQYVGYDLSEPIKNPIDMTVTVYDDGSVDLPFKKGATFPQTSMITWDYSGSSEDNFKKEFYNQANQGSGKYACPDLSLYYSTMGVHSLYVGSFIQDGFALLKKGTAIVENPEQQIVVTTKCPFEQKTEGINLTYTFYMNSIGKKYLEIQESSNANKKTVEITGATDFVARLGGKEFNFSIAADQVNSIFRNVNSTKHTFTCPSKIYLNYEMFDNVGAGTYRYTISTVKSDPNANPNPVDPNNPNGPNGGGETVNPGGTTAIKYVKCGNIDRLPELLPKVISFIVNLIKIAVPIGLVIIGSIDFMKAVTSSDDDPMKKAGKTFIRRLIAAAMVFLVVFIIQIIVGIVAKQADRDSFNQCWDCFLNNNCEKYQ